MSKQQHNILLRPAFPAEIQPLRGKILRPATGVLIFPQDNETPPAASHFAAFTNFPPQTCIACLSFFLSPYQNTPALQLRGMAVHPDFRRQHLGSALLHFAESQLPPDIHLLWCNARLTAIPFYLHLGWRSVSPTFTLPDAGPHQIMLKQLPVSPTSSDADPPQ